MMRLTFVLMLALAPAVFGESSGNGTTREKFASGKIDLSKVTLVNFCGENILGKTGSLAYSTTFQVNGGSFLAKSSVNAHGTGNGVFTGIEYKVNGGNNSVVTGTFDGSIATRATGRWKLDSKGQGGDDQYLIFKLNVVYEDDVLTTKVDDLRIVCGGENISK